MSRSASTATAATTASSNTSIWIVEIIGLPVRDDGEIRAEVNFDVALNNGGGGLVGGAEKGIDASQHLAGEIFKTAAAEIARATVSATNRFEHETGTPENTRENRLLERQ